MKIRTDFVTNSSSSNFCVEIAVAKTNGRVYDVRIEAWDGDWNADFECNPKKIMNIGSVGELIRLLKNSIIIDDGYDEEDEESIGRYEFNRDWPPFEKEVKANIKDVKEISTITIKRLWYATGEFASCTFRNGNLKDSRNLKELYQLAKQVCELEGTEKENAVNAMEKYLEETEAQIYGDYNEPYWPTGFLGSKGCARFEWDGSIEELAELIVNGGLSSEDNAEEETFIDMQEKTISQTATYFIQK